jgi:hypothetical protein
MKRTHLSLIAIIGIVVSLLATSPAAAQISLGTAAGFTTLGGSAVTNTGTTVVTGNVGVSPGSSVTGFPPGIVIGGTIHSADAVAAQAQVALTAAYNAAAGLPCGTDLTGQDLGGMTLTPGVYCFSSSAFLTGTLTLDFQGDPLAQFVFQIGTTLVTASGSTVNRINTGGTACPPNLFWQVGSSATLGTGSSFAGNILANMSITVTTGTGVNGRTLARTGAVTLDTDVLTACSGAVGPNETGIPTLSNGLLLLLGAAMAGVALMMMRR